MVEVALISSGPTPSSAPPTSARLNCWIRRT